MKPQPVGNILDQVIKSLGIDTRLRQEMAVTIWPTIVGKRIAAVSEALNMRGGILFVKVKSDVWRNELILQKRRILENLRGKVGEKVVSDIRFI